MIVFCSSCGKEISEKLNFCSTCGTKTAKGAETNIPIPTERSWEQDLEQGVSEVGRGIGKAFSIAGKELEKAFKPKERVVCTNCEEMNLSDSKFCHKCGNKLT